MPVCDTCGNDDRRTFTLTMGPISGVFDSFECAIEAFAPRCGHCRCRVLGHGVEAGGSVYCCRHCAEMVDHGLGRTDPADHAGDG